MAKAIIKGILKKSFSLIGLEIKRKQQSKGSNVTQYFNTGDLTPLEENSEDLYDKFYADEDALKEYYQPNGYRFNFYTTVIEYALNKGVNFEKKTIIDVGCGIGYLVHFLKNKFPSAITIGSDFSLKAVEFSSKQFPDSKFFKHNLNDALPEVYDVIICTEVLEHLERPYLALSNMLNSLQKGGHIILTVPNGRKDNINEHINFWSPESWWFFLDKECSGCIVETSTFFNNSINVALITKK